jgi:hypothetical protein
MTKAKPKVSTIAQAVKAYGSTAKMARAFQVKSGEVRQWAEVGYVPKIHHLGIVVGLRMRGRLASAKLFGLENWQELPGV